LIKFLTPEISTSISTHAPLSLSWIIIFYLFLGMVLFLLI
jgi:hypothetical protein